VGSIYLRGNVWWLRYSQNGKAFYESSRSKKKSVAVQLLKRREGEVERGDTPGIHYDRTKYEELRDAFLWDREVNGKGVQEARYRLTHLDPYFGGMRVTRISSRMVEDYIRKRTKEEEAANASVNRELACLKRMFKLGSIQRPAKVNLAMVPHITMLEEDNVRKGFFEVGDFLALEQALPAWLRPIARFAWVTGWRKSEVTELTWDRVDLEAGTVRLDPGTTKNRKGRTIWLDPSLLSVVAQQKERQKATGKITRWVFPGPSGLKPVKDFRSSWQKACKDAGIGPRRFHDLRRSAIRNMVRAGVSEHTAMRISGHRTRSVFDRYDVISNADVKEAAERTAAYLDGAKSTKSVTVGKFGQQARGQGEG
jgi:integrase